MCSMWWISLLIKPNNILIFLYTTFCLFIHPSVHGYLGCFHLLAIENSAVISMGMKIWASLVVQLVKNPPTMQKTLVRFLVWEDPLEKEMAPTLVFLPGKSQGQRNLTGYSPWGRKAVRHNLVTKQQHNDNLTFSICWKTVLGILSR